MLRGLIISKNEEQKLKELAERLMVISHSKKEAMTRALIRMFGSDYPNVIVH